MYLMMVSTFNLILGVHQADAEIQVFREDVRRGNEKSVDVRQGLFRF